MSLPLRERISSPLEAGTSIVDGHYLPAPLTPALEYTSKRLARKALHLTCVVVRRDYQLPSPTLSSPGVSGFSSPAELESLPSVSTSNTPVRPSFTTSPIGALKSIVRSSINSDDGSSQQRRGQSLDLQRNATASPTFSDVSLHSAASSASTASTANTTFTSIRARWGLNSAQSPSIPMTPATPFTVMSSTTGTTDADSATSGALANGPQQFGIKLLHANPVTAKEDKSLRNSLERAARKYNIGPEWLSNPLAPSRCGLTGDLIDRSLLQNEVLFTSEGLTLLALDHLYTFKCALQSYSGTNSPCRLEDAVDELRRLVLGNDMRKLRKSTLVHNYTWLGSVEDKALKDVRQMYQKAYGSYEGDNGLDDDMDMPNWPLPEARFSLHGSLAVEDQGTTLLTDDSLRMLSFEDLVGKPLPKTPIAVQSPVEPQEEGRGRSLICSSTPKPARCSPRSASPKNSIGTPGRRKSPPAALNFSRPPSQSEIPLRSGCETPRSTVTEQSETARSAASNLTTKSERAATPSLDRWAEEKEFLGMEIELDMDEIEDWYREVDIDLDTISFKPARMGICLPEPPPQVEEIRLATVSRTANLAPQPPPQSSPLAKVGLLGLKLDTTFQKPRRRGETRGHQLSQSMDAVIGSGGLSPGGGNTYGPSSSDLAISLEALDLAGEDTEEELTARPPDSAHPATEGLKGFVRWNSTSIDSVLSPVEGPADRDGRVGPMTPNGYDDISPITRGEWGFLMVGGEWKNGRQVNITKCL